MRHLVRDYAFNSAAKTITINGIDQLRIEDIILITHLPSGSIIYNFAAGSLGGTLVGNTITLEYDTTTYQNSDPIQIFIDVEDADMSALTGLLANGLSEIVRQLQAIRNDGGMADAAGRVRVAMESGTLPTVTTVGTVNNVAAAGYSLQTYTMTSTNAGPQNLRSKITVS